MTSPPTMTILSLGAGVQSTVLALMAADGELPGLDGAIFADTGWEPAAVYQHLTQVEAVLTAASIPLYRVRSGNLRNDSINPGRRYASIPYFVRNPDGSAGMARRQCTSEYKLAPINREVRELLGAKAPHYRRAPKGRLAEQWIGFSTDEIGRVNDRRDVRYVQKRYPLLELGMDRKACARWLAARGWTSVQKSACIGCPFHGNAQWRRLRDESPDEWADAVAFDAAIRKGGARGVPLHGEAFLHRSRIPLDQAPIDRVTAHEWSDRQIDVFDLVAELGDPDGCSPYGCRSGLPRGRCRMTPRSPGHLAAPGNPDGVPMSRADRHPKLPDGVRAIGWIAEEGPYAHLTQEVDLDELLLAMAAHETAGGNYEWDDPTYISAGIYGNDGEEDEALVGWLRTMPCGERCPWRCEEDFRSHIIKAAGPGRGAFLAVRFR